MKLASYNNKGNKRAKIPFEQHRAFLFYQPRPANMFNILKSCITINFTNTRWYFIWPSQVCTFNTRRLGVMCGSGMGTTTLNVLQILYVQNFTAFSLTYYTYMYNIPNTFAILFQFMIYSRYCNI